MNSAPIILEQECIMHLFGVKKFHKIISTEAQRDEDYWEKKKTLKKHCQEIFALYWIVLIIDSIEFFNDGSNLNLFGDGFTLNFIELWRTLLYFYF